MKRTSIKRTQALKSILEQQQANGSDTASGLQIIEGSPNTLAIPKIEISPKGLIGGRNIQTVQFGSTQDETSTARNIDKIIPILHELIDKEMTKAAKLLGIHENELKAWTDLYSEVPAKTILALLRNIQSLLLDPLKEEISLTKHEDGNWQVFITVDGCSKVLNQHSQFNGLLFIQAQTLIEGTPEWMECAIYRKDRILPITVREYFVEVKGQSEIWQKMPRRMLRHRVLQQCVRLAMG